MGKLTLEEKLVSRKIKRPPLLAYPVLARLWALFYNKKLGVHFDYKIDPKKIKDNFIVVSNHASRLDYLYTGYPFLPHRLNYVSGYNEFFRSHLAGIFRFVQIIPKKNFVADIYTIKEVSRVLRNGGNIILFPEGMSSISGSNQPVALGSGKFIKHFKLPVYMTKISGGYLTSTKYCLDERKGRVDVVIDQLFTPEDLERMTEQEIQDKLNEVLYNDDYAWNKKMRVKYDTKGNIAHNINDLLYRCPKCGKEFKMVGEKDEIRCTECGNGAKINDYYDLIPFNDSCVIPETPKVWFDQEREVVRKEIEDKNFKLTEKIKLAELPKYKYLKNQKTGEITGEGVLTLTNEGLFFEGVRNEKEYSFHVLPENLPTYGCCVDVNFFYTYVDGEYFEFQPENKTTAKWILATEEIHRKNNGKWQNYYLGK